MRRSLPLLAALLALLSASPARAQLHTDVAAMGVAKKRFLVDGDDASPGGGLEIVGHVALLPLVRVGLYASGEVSPQGRAAAGPYPTDVPPARQIYAFGLHARVFSPWPNGKVRLWGGTGVGYALIFLPSYGVVVPGGLLRGGLKRPDRTMQVFSASGSFFEVPIGIGAGYKFWHPWEVMAELGGSLAFGESGSAYRAREFDDPNVTGTQTLPSAGTDRGAVFFKLGIGVDF